MDNINLIFFGKQLQIIFVRRNIYKIEIFKKFNVLSFYDILLVHLVCLRTCIEGTEIIAMHYGIVWGERQRVFPQDFPLILWEYSLSSPPHTIP